MPSASFGCITPRKSHLVQRLGWLQQIFGCPKFYDFYGSTVIPFVFLTLVSEMYSVIHFDLSHDMTKSTKWYVRPAKTQISLGIRPVWSESSLCAQLVAKDPSFLHVDSDDSDQTGRIPRLIWVFAGRTAIFVGFVMTRLILFSCIPDKAFRDFCLVLGISVLNKGV